MENNSFEHPGIIIAILPEDMENVEEIDGKKRVTVERTSAGVDDQAGSILSLEMPDGTKATGKIIASDEIEKTEDFTNKKYRWVIEIQPD